MIEFKHAQEKILKSIKPLQTEKISVLDSLKRILSKNVYSKISIPEFDNSAMDGYAIRSKDTINANNSPVHLKVIGEITPGIKLRKRISPGSAIKIMTGAMIPSGTDAVIPVEETESTAKPLPIVTISRTVKRGENVRYIGENIKAGDMVAEKGKIIRAYEIGILIQAGWTKVEVSKVPTVSILSTGNELVDIDEKMTHGKIRNINSYTLYNEVSRCGAKPISLGIAKDVKKYIKQKILTGLNSSDILLISAGISVGDYDYVKEILKEICVKEIFWKVKIRPGKPIYFGIKTSRNSSKYVFGLPGNTVSSLICFKQFVEPSIFKLQGISKPVPPAINAICTQNINYKSGKTYFLRGKTKLIDGNYYVELTGPQGSGILKSLSDADCLIILQKNKTQIKKGDNVKIQLI